MRFLEFQAQLNADHTLTVPTHIADQIQGDQSVRVVLVVSSEEEDQQWAQLTAAEFLRGYSDGDAMYDQLSTR